jgi:hypothetical protein
MGWSDTASIIGEVSGWRKREWTRKEREPQESSNLFCVSFGLQNEEGTSTWTHTLFSLCCVD